MKLNKNFVGGQGVQNKPTMGGGGGEYRDFLEQHSSMIVRIHK